VKTTISKGTTLLRCASWTLIAFGWSFLALEQRTQAVTPSPDGGYPGANTAEGENALLNLTTGVYNTAVGFLSLRSNPNGNFNTGIGAGALLLTTGDSNTATGAGALLSNTAGTDNTAEGVFALFLNTANGNTAIGSRALFNNTGGGAVGNVNGFDLGPNVAVGSEALESNTLASANTAMGYQALRSFANGPLGFEQIGLCTAVGFQALANATGVGNANSGFGYQALKNDTTGQGNTATGFYALVSNVTGDFNTANGFVVLQRNTAGSYNTAIGDDALGFNTTGSNNIALGYSAGQGTITGNNNIYIGSSAGDESDTMRLGGTQTATYIAGVNTATIPAGVPVVIDTDAHVGILSSSQRFKEDIKSMSNVSEALFSLKPVTFRYKKQIDPKSAQQLGLIAEEVEKVSPDLIVRDNQGRPYSVRYDQVNAMLLNEFLKEHRKVQELEKGMIALTAELKEQGAQIENMNAHVRIHASPTKTELVAGVADPARAGTEGKE